MTGYSFDHDLADLLSDGTLPELAPVPAPTPLRMSGKRRLQPVLWTGAGFIAGAVFWHLIGFWSFVSDVAFNATDGLTPTSGKSGSTLVRRNAPPRPAATGEITTGSLPDSAATGIDPAKEPHGCITAARAETGSIVLVPCAEAPPTTRSVLAAPKQDLVTLPPSHEPAAALPPEMPVPLNAAPQSAASQSNVSGVSSHTKDVRVTPAAAPHEIAPQEIWESEVDISISADPAAARPRSLAPGQRIFVEPPPSTR